MSFFVDAPRDQPEQYVSFSVYRPRPDRTRTEDATVAMEASLDTVIDLSSPYTQWDEADYEPAIQRILHEGSIESDDRSWLEQMLVPWEPDP